MINALSIDTNIAIKLINVFPLRIENDAETKTDSANTGIGPGQENNKKEANVPMMAPEDIKLFLLRVKG